VYRHHSPNTPLPPPPFPKHNVLALLAVEAGEGLSYNEAWARLLACGENQLGPHRAPGYFHIFLEEVYEGPQVGGFVGGSGRSIWWCAFTK
jgi:hypothetical protein